MILSARDILVTRSDNKKMNISYVQYSDVIMGTMASQITSLTIVYSTFDSGADHRKHQSSASLAFVWGIHRVPVNSPHKWPVTRKMYPFEDVIMSGPLAFVRGIHRLPVNSPHKWPVTRKLFPFDDVIMFPKLHSARQGISVNMFGLVTHIWIRELDRH